MSMFRKVVGFVVVAALLLTALGTVLANHDEGWAGDLAKLREQAQSCVTKADLDGLLGCLAKVVTSAQAVQSERNSSTYAYHGGPSWIGVDINYPRYSAVTDPQITAVYQYTPAARAGIRNKDRIVAIIDDAGHAYHVGEIENMLPGRVITVIVEPREYELRHEKVYRQYTVWTVAKPREWKLLPKVEE